MFFMACYHLDKFREFIFKSSFLNKFEVDEQTQKAIKENDIELLKFGCNWLRFVIFGEKTILVKDDVMESKKRAMEEQPDQEKGKK